jgi:hypothetical protein
VSQEAGVEWYSELDTPTIVPSVTAVQHLTFLGCYRDNKERDFCCGPVQEYRDTTKHTPESCAAECPQFKYFALQFGGECFCDNAFSTPAAEYPKISDAECGSTGSEAVRPAGRGFANAVYGWTRGDPSATHPQASQEIPPPCHVPIPLVCIPHLLLPSSSPPASLS